MRNASSSSVKVRWFDYETVWEAVKRLSREVGEEHSEVEQVVVFGSLVRRAAVPGSDVDVLIIISESDVGFLDRIPKFMPIEPFPVDIEVFPYTRREIEEMLEAGNFFIRQALSEGITVFRRD